MAESQAVIQPFRVALSHTITYKEDIYWDHVPVFAAKLLIRIWTNNTNQWTIRYIFSDEQLDYGGKHEFVRKEVLLASRRDAWERYATCMAFEEMVKTWLNHKRS